jgi:hypothetical protein
MRNEPEHEIALHGVCFADWLNEVDARIDYDVRRQISLVEWRHLYDFEYTVKDACLMALTGRVR